MISSLLLSGLLTVSASYDAGHAEISFVIRNTGSSPVSLPIEDSPCAHEELAIFVVQGIGMFGSPKLPLSLIEETVSSSRLILPGQSYTCAYDVRHWFGNDVVDSAQTAADESRSTLMWSFHPRKQGLYKNAIYGGSFVMQIPRR